MSSGAPTLLLLAAGMGRRLGAMGADTPKVLLPLPTGRTLLRENIDSALASGAIAAVTVVAGHRSELVADELRRISAPAPVEMLLNPDYASHGPIRSLWAARDLLKRGDLVIANGDTFYDPRAFRAVVASRSDGLALGYSRRPCSQDDVKLLLTGTDRLAAVGKSLPAPSCDGVSAGLLLVAGDDERRLLFETLSRFARAQEEPRRKLIWHDLVHEIAVTGGRVKTVALDPSWWHEVDTPEDLTELSRILTRRPEHDLAPVADAPSSGPA
jgi:choline kinase